MTLCILRVTKHMCATLHQKISVLMNYFKDTFVYPCVDRCKSFYFKTIFAKNLKKYPYLVGVLALIQNIFSVFTQYLIDSGLSQGVYHVMATWS